MHDFSPDFVAQPNEASRNEVEMMWNDVGMTEWLKNDFNDTKMTEMRQEWQNGIGMTLEMWNGIWMASNDNGMTSEWWYSDRMK